MIKDIIILNHLCLPPAYESHIFIKITARVGRVEGKERIHLCAQSLHKKSHTHQHSYQKQIKHGLHRVIHGLACFLSVCECVCLHVCVCVCQKTV